jgi:hypothetical protein
MIEKVRTRRTELMRYDPKPLLSKLEPRAKEWIALRGADEIEEAEGDLSAVLRGFRCGLRKAPCLSSGSGVAIGIYGRGDVGASPTVRPICSHLQWRSEETPHNQAIRTPFRITNCARNG